MSATWSPPADWNCLQVQGGKVDFTRLCRRAPDLEGGENVCGERRSLVSHRVFKNHSSNFKFAALTTSRTFTMSSSTMRRKSAGGPPPGVTARFLSFAETSGSRIDWLSVVSSLAMIAAG